ncbi:3-hydroxyacyl-CoA dehydrogenase family protein [Verrucomicrobiota bacterium]
MKADEISAIAVIGAGTMGAGIAGEFARIGCRVCMLDVDQDRLDHGMKAMARAQAALTNAGMLSKAEARTARKRVTPTPCLEMACEGIQLLVEAASENLRLKKKLFRRFDEVCPKRAILASNTSGLSITQIASAVTRPARVAGLHFWNPPHIIPLVEVTRGETTSAATARALVDVCRRLGKRPILVRHDVPGFVGNRLQFAVLREALHLLDEGIASADDIDTAMTAGPGLRWAFMGPLRTADLGGLDIFHAISRYLFAELASNPGPRGTLKKLVRKNHLGAKTGQGFFEYTGGDLGRTVRERDRVLLDLLGVLRETMNPDK